MSKNPSPKGSLLEDLKKRQLIADLTPTLNEALEQPITLYFGIDPTSDSLHLGSFLGVLMMERFRLAGHRPIALVGGATGMIGDPSGRSKERNLLDVKTLKHNFKSIRTQIQNLTEIPNSDFVDNRQWTEKIKVLDFLRDVGKHATVSQMISKESIKARMESADGISFTEFSYLLLQSYDFYWLNENMDCVLQIGGSDQWGNITAGIDLIRRKSGREAHGLTWHLIEKEDGQKFGKTAEGTIWLDENKTSPFNFYQYLVNLDDKTACMLLYWLTLSPCEELDEIVLSHNKNPQDRQAQQYLANWVTTYVHGEKAASEATASSKIAFTSGTLTVQELEALRGTMPETLISKTELEVPDILVELLIKTDLCSSKSDARRQIKQGAISVNGTVIKSGINNNAENNVEPDLSSADFIDGKYLLLGRGKRTKHLLVLK